MEEPDKKNIEDILALSPMQEGMLFHYLQDTKNDYYFEQLSLVMSGLIDREIFEKAWNFVVVSNEMLRAVFRWEEVEKPVQVILRKHKPRVGYIDFSKGDVNELRNGLEKVKKEDKQKSFDLRDVPFRIMLCKLKENSYEMVIGFHHILYDGWSTGIILREFFNAYNDLTNGKVPERPIKSKYKDFVKWLQEQDINRQERFWKNYLVDFDTGTQLSIKKKKGKENDAAVTGSRSYRLKFERDLKTRLENFVRKNKITLASFLSGAWGLLIQMYNNSADVIIGTTVSGRPVEIPGIEDIAGLFINTIPLRIRTFPGEKIAAFLSRVDKEIKTREEYEQTPLIKIKEYSDLDPQAELFDTIVVIENYPLEHRFIPGNCDLLVDSYSMTEMTHYDLTLAVTFFDNIELDFGFNTGTLAENAIVRMSAHFKGIIEDMMSFPDRRISGLEIISKEEKKRVLDEFNDTRATFPAEKTIHGLFEDQVLLTPDGVALLEENKIPEFQISNEKNTWDGNILVTYNELNRRSDLLAGLLSKRGSDPNTIAAIMVDRSIEMIVGILGVLKSGGAYLPIDPEYPLERINYMLEDCGAKFLVTVNGLAKDIEKLRSLHPQKNPGIIFIDSIDSSDFSSSLPLDFSTSHSIQSNHSGNLAYIIYTSGSTGKPKGVAVNHGLVVNLIVSRVHVFKINRDDRILLFTSFCFDTSVEQIFISITGGAVLAIIDNKTLCDAHEFEDFICRHWITHIDAVPSFLSNIDFKDKRKYHLKRIISGGGTCPIFLAKKLSAYCDFYNAYGPTETTVTSIEFLAGDVDETLPGLPIGRPIANTEVFLLDQWMRIVPIGVVGELYIGGGGVSRGYLNNPELTARKFIKPDLVTGLLSTGGVYSKRLYNSGDLARWLEDGNIEFSGRKDAQVKIWGFRIELEEIENRLLKYKDIKEAVVIAREDVHSENHLYAFIVSEKEPVVSELRRHLSGELPPYMVPAFFSRIDKIPLKSSGKADRRKLSFMASSDLHRLKTGQEYVSPGGHIEKTITGILQQLLGGDNIGIHDNFFDLGLNSSSMIRFNNRLKKALKKDIPMVALFNYSTVSSLAGFLREKRVEREEREEEKKSEKGKKTGERGKEVAIIGMSGRFPGAKNIDEFWENLENGVEAVSFFSEEEVAARGVGTDIYNNPDYVKAKAVLDNMTYFDPGFFGYSTNEARLMDPQLRILHECVWEALENAGYAPGSYKGSIGLYVGALDNYWWMRQLYHLMSTHSDLLSVGSLNDRDYLATRISYKLNLKGPAVTVQTACSTSLTAVDMACQALISGRCDMALAGGISLTFEDQGGFLYEQGMVRSPDGHCRPFDARARGTVGGNGVGIVVLKSLSGAAAAGDAIRAVIKGSATNNDGARKVGYTAPSVEGQVEVIRAAQQTAGLDPGSITYLETHGTGTALGDPVEIEALKQVFNIDNNNNTHNTNKKPFCCLGAVKANIGHLDAAAGIAGLIKTVLMLEHRLIPPSVNFETPNPQIDFENSPFFINRERLNWENPDNRHPLRAGISSFGIGGTNAHVIIQESPDNYKMVQSTPARDHRLIALSAKTPGALDRMATNLAGYLKRNPGINLADVSYTLLKGRAAFKHRRFAVCKDVAEAIRQLSTGKSGQVHTSFTPDDEKRIIFMFPGQGAQYVNMGLELYQKEPVFREVMNRCFERLKPILGVKSEADADMDIKEVLYPRPGSPASKNINRTVIAQPVLFILEYALAKLLISWGIKPDVMIGHSIGEYTAAALSGVFSWEDALHVVTARGRLTQQQPGGSMLGVPLPEQEVIPLLEANISLAAVNSPRSCVVSGEVKAVEAFARKLEKKGIMGRQLHTSHAFHSRMMEPILPELEKHVDGVKLNSPQIPYISNITGNRITREEATSPGYWARHLGQTVRFLDGLTELLKYQEAVFMEVGPGKTLSTFVKQHHRRKPGHRVVNLLKHANETGEEEDRIAGKTGQLWHYGVDIDWTRFYANEKRQRIALPAYPFESRFYWPEVITHPGDKETKEAKKKEMADWFYVPSWQLSVLPPISRENLDRKLSIPGAYVIFMDSCGLGARLKENLQRANRVVIQVEIGKTFEKKDHHVYTVNPQEEGDYNRLLIEMTASGIIPGYVVHFWTITQSLKRNAGLSGFDADKLEDRLNSGFYSLIYLAKAIDKAGIVGNDRGMSIFVVSNHLFDVMEGEVICPGKATVLGACRVIPQEFPRVSCTCIDIVFPGKDSRADDRTIHHLVTELSVNTLSTERVIAWRGKQRWGQTFQAVPLPGVNKEAVYLKEKGVYLILGGIGDHGGIGFLLARFMARQTGIKLVLGSRKGLPPRQEWKRWLDNPGDDPLICSKINRVQELENLGAEVLTLKADAARPEEIEAVRKQTEEHFGPINGIIHCAAETGNETIHLIREDREKSIYEAQFAAKMYGVVSLYRVFRDKSPDFCVLMSSLASIMGPLAAYSAANNFMDAFVRFLEANEESNREASTGWLSVNWDNWLPLDNNLPFTRQLALTPEEGVEAFHRILSWGGASQVLVSTGDIKTRMESAWNKHLDITETSKSTTKSIPRAEELPGFAGSQAGSGTGSPPDSSVVPRDEYEQVVAGAWEDLFGISRVGVDDNFFELGGDSLQALRFTAYLQKNHHIDVPIAEILHRQTLADIAGYIRESMTRTGEIFKTPTNKEKKEEYMLFRGKQPVQADRHKPFPLTPLQTAYLLGRDSLFEIGGVSTHIYQECEINIEIQRLNLALNKMIRRHPMLRVIVSEDGRQQILAAREYEIKVEDLRHLDAEIQNQCILKERERMSHYIFSTDQWPLFEIKGYWLARRRYYIFFSMDHLIADDASLLIFIDELSEFCFNPDFDPHELEFTFRDYVLASQELKKGEKYQASVKYWQDKLADFPMAAAVPLKCAPSSVNNPHFKRLSNELSPPDWAELKKIANENRITPSVLLCTAYAGVLSYWSNQPGFAINLTLFNRFPFHRDVEKIIGDFTTVILLGLELNPGSAFWEKARILQDTLMEALEHRYYDGMEFLRDLRTYRRAGTQALMPMVFTSALVNPVESRRGTEKIFDFWGSQKQVGMALSQTSQVFIDCIAGEWNGALELHWDYVEQIFDEDIIRAMFNQYIKIIYTILRGRGDYTLQPPTPHKNILESLNADTEADYPGKKTIHELFEEQVVRQPDRVALLGGKQETNKEEQFRRHQGTGVDEIISLSYHELNRRCHHLARLLIKKGVKSDTVVGIMIERSVEMIVAILGILKAGGAYLPVDPQYPEDRIEYMLKDSSARVLISIRTLAKEVKKLRSLEAKKNLEIIFIDSIEFSVFSSSHLLNFSTSHSTTLAYIIYTSGTTGKSKGMAIEHRNVVRLLFNSNFLFDFSARDTWSLFHSYCFDFSVWEMYGALLYGGKLIVVSRMTARDTSEFLALLKRENITVLNQTPSSFYNLCQEEMSANNKRQQLNLKYVIFGGEALNPGILRDWKQEYPGIKLINMFGITETTVHVTYKEITPGEILENIGNIGKPIATLRVYVLNGNLEVLPVGVAGELWVVGEGVGRGYVNRPELTAGRFLRVENYPGLSHLQHDIQRISPGTPVLYRSGDRVRVLANSDLEYLGRIDRQVKVRGFRVEPGEIERRLMMHERVKSALVILKTGKTGDTGLCAYVVTDKGSDLAGLRGYLMKYLPEYMVPSFFVGMETLPLTPNGKVNHKLLPEPGILTAVAYSAPRDFIEKKLVDIWSELMNFDKSDLINNAVGIDDNFFEIGGDSLKAVTLQTRIHKELQVKLPMAEVFRTPSIRELAACIKKLPRGVFSWIEPAEKKEYYALSSAQKRLYILQQMEPLSTAYNMPDIIPWQVNPDSRQLEKAFLKLIERHHSLQTSFVTKDDEPIQRISHRVEFSLHYFNVKSGSDAANIMQDFIRPFDLTRAPLLKVGLAVIEEEKTCLLLVDMHHIISDGVSQVILETEFMALYREEGLHELRLQYKDFSEWQNRLIESGAFEKKGKYWLGRFKDNTPVLNMPTDFPRPRVVDFRGRRVYFYIPPLLTGKTRKLARESGTTLYVFLLAVFNLLISKYTGQEDIVIGSDNAGRVHADLNHIIGFFANMLPLRNFPRENITFHCFLQEVKDNMLAALENQQYQFEELVSRLKLTRNTGRHPLVDMVFSIGDAEAAEKELRGKVEFVDFEHNIAHFDLLVIALDLDHRLDMTWEYSTTLFKKSTIEKMGERYIEILEQVLENPHIQLKDIKMAHGFCLVKAGILENEAEDWEL